MKVFGCKRSGGYSGGLIIVAANSLDEAFETFAKDDRYEWMIDWFDFDTGKIIEDVAKVDSNTYPRDDWFEIPELVANVDSPRVISEDGYTE